MTGILPVELFDLIQSKCLCRELQIRQLTLYYNNTLPSPPILVAHGLEQASRRDTIKTVLETQNIPHVTIRGTECLSQRHLLSKIFASCLVALGQGHQIDRYEKTDSINTLLSNLHKLFNGLGRKKLVVVIEDADGLKQAGPTLLAAVARLGDLVPGLSVILTSNSSRPLTLHRAGVPYVHFLPYTRSEAIRIVTSRLKSRVPPDLPHTDALVIDETALLKLYPQFAATVYDSLISSTCSTSMQTFQSACDSLWPRFIAPVTSLPATSEPAKPWTFARLLVVNRGLFQTEGESVLHNNLTRSQSTLAGKGEVNTLSPPPDPSSHQPPLLKHFPTLILLGAYLASHTQQKDDIVLFSRMSSGSSKKKVRRPRQRPTKKSASTPQGTPSKEGTTPTKSRTKSVFSATATLGIARPFMIERLVGILRAIHPHGVANGKGVSDRVYRELGELEKLRLVVRVSTGSSATGDDVTEEKWRVNVNREWVVGMGEAWGLSVREYELEHDL